MGFIYKITNAINGKIYIGQTSRTINVRWREHKSRSKTGDKSYLHNAIAKYGTENFEIEMVEECPQLLLNEREIYWIDFFNSYYPNGYNLTVGGGGNQKIDQEKIVQLWEEGLARQEIAERLGIASSTVSAHLQGYPTYSVTESRSRTEQKNQTHFKPKKKVCQYTWEGKFIKQYNSLREAVEAFGENERTISYLSAACRGALYTWRGYQWRYAGDAPPAPLKNPIFPKRKVAQYTLEGKLVKIFPSTCAAAREVDPKQATTIVANQIQQVCRHNRKTARGYRWEYIDTYDEGQ